MCLRHSACLQTEHWAALRHNQSQTSADTTQPAIEDLLSNIPQEITHMPEQVRPLNACPIINTALHELRKQPLGVEWPPRYLQGAQPMRVNLKAHTTCLGLLLTPVWVHVQVKETFNTFGEHLRDQAFNATYHKGKFEELLTQLQDPVTVSLQLTSLQCVLIMPKLRLSSAGLREASTMVLHACRSRQEQACSLPIRACLAPTWALWRRQPQESASRRRCFPSTLPVSTSPRRPFKSAR